MSVENVRAFFKQVQADPVLRARLKTIGVVDKSAATAQIIRIAGEAGFPFTAEQYEAATQAHQGPPAPRRG